MGQDKSEIRHQIERTRARLGETVDALAYKLDVKSRFREALGERIDEAKRAVRSATEAARSATDAARAAVINNVRREEPHNGRSDNSATGARAG